MNNQTEIETIVQEKLNKLKSVPERTPQAANRARARFLTQAVSANEPQRHKGWKSIFRKEQFAMNILISVFVIAGLLIGGGTTVKAAQDDLPGEPLYAVKTFSENVSLQFRNSPEAKVDRLLDLSQTRVQEMTRLIESGQTPPEQVRLRLEQHLQQALQLCSNMEDAALDQKLLQLRDRLRQQERDMQQLQIHASQDAQPTLERTRTMLQTQLQLIDDGLLNHEMFRNTVRNGFHYGQTQTPPPSVPPTPSAPNGQQNGQTTPQAGPNNGNGSGPNGQQNGQSTPQAGPNNSNGAGPNPSTTPMPNNGGNGTGSGNSSGGNDGGSGSGGSGSGGSGSGGKGP
ncbi:MAG: hypothetical protein JW730_16465 [Anaerolineales bacterium]|nr:hypothetical protein [Anaerolineales bacterium]